MKKNIQRTSILRFPLLFGGILGLAAIAFVYRDNWLGDIEAERNKLFTGNPEGNKMLEDLKERHRRR